MSKTRFYFLAIPFLVALVVSAPVNASERPEEEHKRYVGDLLNCTYYEATGWCEVEWMSHYPWPQAICNFDLGKLQTINVLETPEAVVHPCIFIHSEMPAESQEARIERGVLTSEGRKENWPTLAELPDPNGPPAFVFFDSEGKVISQPDPDMLLLMQTCAAYVAANEAKINEDWQKLLLAREEWRRQAEIDAAKPKPPYQPPVFLKVETSPGSGIPGVLRQADIEEIERSSP